MKKSKDRFMDYREIVQNHFDRGVKAYAIEQGRDRKEIEQLQGIKHYWK